MYHFGPKIRPTCFVLAYAAACVFLFLCNVIKMIKMVCSRAISSWYICWSLGICAYISFVYGEMLHSGALCVCVRNNDREREAEVQSNGSKRNGTIKHLVAFLFLIVLLVLLEPVSIVFVIRWRFSSTKFPLQIVWYGCFVAEIEWNHPLNGVSVFFSLLHCSRQMLSESCYYYNEFWRCHRLYTTEIVCTVSGMMAIAMMCWADGKRERAMWNFFFVFHKIQYGNRKVPLGFCQIQ